MGTLRFAHPTKERFWTKFVKKVKEKNDDCLFLALADVSDAVCDTGCPGQPGSLTEDPIPQSFGVNIHFVDGDLPENMAYLQKAGFGWVRVDMSWESIERQRGVYDFSAYDRLIDTTQNTETARSFHL